jgi:two-component system LytT family response regulator
MLYQNQLVENIMNPQLDLALEICLKTLEGFSFFKYSDIVRFEADGNYTLVYVLHQDKPRKVFHTFTEVEEKVSGNGLFFKCQRSNIINIHHLKHFCIKRNLLITENGVVPISDTYVKEFKERYCK